jgi:hypothetical protein
MNFSNSCGACVDKEKQTKGKHLFLVLSMDSEKN